MSDYFAIYHEATGNISGLSTFQPLADNIPPDFVIKGFVGDLPRNIGLWDSTTLEFITEQILSFPLTRLQFLERFTASERIAIRQSTDPYIYDFMDLLAMATMIDLLDPQIAQALQYMEYVGLISHPRAEEILKVS